MKFDSAFKLMGDLFVVRSIHIQNGQVYIDAMNPKPTHKFSIQMCTIWVTIYRRLWGTSNPADVLAIGSASKLYHIVGTCKSWSLPFPFSDPKQKCSIIGGQIEDPLLFNMITWVLSIVSTIKQKNNVYKLSTSTNLTETRVQIQPYKQDEWPCKAHHYLALVCHSFHILTNKCW